MNVAELQEYLSDFHPKTKVEVVVNNFPIPFELLFGGSDGCTKQTADNVAFHVQSTSEAAKEVNSGSVKC